MRYLTSIVMMLPLAALTLAAAGPALATASSSVDAIKRHDPRPTFDDCFRLAWVRGVHVVERDELGAFNEYCLTNQVPFDSGFTAGSVQRGSR